jgi:hypothetical protein
MSTLLKEELRLSSTMAFDLIYEGALNFRNSAT